jgi:hypothetical protein
VLRNPLQSPRPLRTRLRKVEAREEREVEDNNHVDAQKS